MPSHDSFLDVSLSSTVKKQRQVFVAYSYRHLDKRDYRRVFERVGKKFEVTFVFADERISSLHILQKIANYIKESQFGIYDITAWNPNVTLELGLALGMGERVFIALNPSLTELIDVPSDLKGVDRLQYSAFSSLEDELERLLSQTLPPHTDEEERTYKLRLQDKIVELVEQSPRISLAVISKAVGVSSVLVKIAIKNELNARLMAAGDGRGTKYFPVARNG